MNTRKLISTLSTAAKATAVGLVLAGAGILIQYLTGVPGFPTIPPGPIIAAVAAALVIWVPWRWAPTVGLAAALFFVVGAAAFGAVPAILDRLADPGSVGPFAGTAIQVVGLAVAVIAGILATVEQIRPAEQTVTR